MKFTVGDIIVEYEPRYAFFSKMAEPFLAEEQEADITIEYDATEIETIHMRSNNSLPVSESFYVLEKLARKMLEYDALWMHSAVISVHENGYAFSAPSGTGKSTHIRLWKKVFGDSVQIVNGDKPFYRLMDDQLLIYPGPWRGKEQWGSKKIVPLKTLCFLEQAETNEIKRLSEDEILPLLLTEVVMPENNIQVDTFFHILDFIVTNIPCYLMKCNISEEAAVIAYNTMVRGEKKNEN